MKRTFIALLLLILTGHAFAQESPVYDYGFRLGLTAHPTIGWVKPEVGKSNSVSPGFSYGLLADFDFARNYSFATGLTITTINGKSQEVFTSNASPAMPPSQTLYDLKYKLQYIEIPLTLKLKTGMINNVRWYGQFGLSNDINIGAHQDADATGVKIRDENISESIKFYRAGLIIGAGAEFDIRGNTAITGGLTFNNGFTDITSDKNSSVKNHYVGINFGVFF
ncbi:porin family protein [Pedobacter metabolipauper]|uniref:Outer membrane protein with beta-barrel domain n=1 Tax=Pedobacter metabolipauper TaxID=425513 RepID=A0A4R6SQV7_9SPHI|nr:porin family protein [Pedobacter metabolipauper]TDQ06680.1 outer membrane protein with beta-barrel domain [Pedobacter metabolipauper]